MPPFAPAELAAHIAVGARNSMMLTKADNTLRCWGVDFPDYSVSDDYLACEPPEGTDVAYTLITANKFSCALRASELRGE